MKGFKDQDLKERLKRAAKARQAVLDKFKAAQPDPNDPEVVKRRQERIEAAEARKVREAERKARKEKEAAERKVREAAEKAEREARERRAAVERVIREALEADERKKQVRARHKAQLKKGSQSTLR